MENDILIDFRFTKTKPGFGDLFLITGETHPKFAPRNNAFGQLAHLGFEQLDDFFGIFNSEEAGDDVIVWLFPMLNGEEVFHNSGSFDAIRLSYNALRNTADSLAILQACYDAFTTHLDTQALFEGKAINSFEPVRAKAGEIISYWRGNQIEPGSEASLLIDEDDDEDWDDDEFLDEDWVDEDEDDNSKK